MAPPFGTTEVDIMFNQGISYYGAIVDTASQQALSKKVVLGLPTKIKK